MAVRSELREITYRVFFRANYFLNAVIGISRSQHRFHRSLIVVLFLQRHHTTRQLPD